MAIKPTNNYFTDFEDNGLFSGEGSVVADIFVDIVPQLAPMTTAAVTAAKQPASTFVPAEAANLALQMATGSIPVNMQYDVNSDGKVNSLDALAIRRGTPLAEISSLPTAQNSAAQVTATAAVAPKTTQETIQNLVSSGVFEQNPNQAQLINGTYYQPIFNSTGSGEDFQQGYLSGVNVYKEAENKVGGNVNWYSPEGTLTQTTQQQEVNPTKDFMEFAAMAGSMFGLPAGIGESLGLAGNTAQAVGQGLLTTGTQLGSGASLGDALTAGLKTGVVPITTAGLSQLPSFNELSPAVQASVASALGNTLANGGQITPGILLSSIAAGVQADKANIGALEGLTNSGRTGDDMGGSYSPEPAVSEDLPSGVQVAAADTGLFSDAGNGSFKLDVGGVPLFAESSGAANLVPPAGYEVMSSSLADNKPEGSFYDASTNAWLAPTNEFANVTNSDQVLNDAALFNNNVNTLDANAVRGLISDSLSQLPQGLTLDDIANVLGNQNFATPEDIQTAINSIDIPQGLTEQNVQTIVSNALANNPSLTTDQVSQIVNNAVANIPAGLTASDVTDLLSKQNFATPEDIQTAINSIDIPKGLTADDVQTIVSDAFTNNPGLTSKDVQSIVDSAVSNIPAGLTAEDVSSLLSKQNYATPEDIQTAINSIDIPKGLNEQDVQTIVSNAFASNPGITTDQVTTIVSDALAKLPAAPTSQDIIDIIGSQGLASSSQLATQNEQLLAAMQAQEDEYQKALQDAFAQQNTLTNDQLSKVLNSAIGLFGSLGAQGAAGGGGNTPNRYPMASYAYGAMQPVPTYSPEYFNQVQQNYNQLLPTVPQDVTSPLANWYNTQYGA